jgi:hypothetical protein
MTEMTDFLMNSLEYFPHTLRATLISRANTHSNILPLFESTRSGLPGRPSGERVYKYDTGRGNACECVSVRENRNMSSCQ